MTEKWLGVPLPIWIVGMAAAIYFFAARAQSGALPSIIRPQTFTTPQLSLMTPAASGYQPGTTAPEPTPYGLIPSQPQPQIPQTVLANGWMKAGTAW